MMDRQANVRLDRVDQQSRPLPRISERVSTTMGSIDPAPAIGRDIDPQVPRDREHRYLLARLVNADDDDHVGILGAKIVCRIQSDQQDIDHVATKSHRGHWGWLRAGVGVTVGRIVAVMVCVGSRVGVGFWGVRDGVGVSAGIVSVAVGDPVGPGVSVSSVGLEVAVGLAAVGCGLGVLDGVGSVVAVRLGTAVELAIAATSVDVGCRRTMPICSTRAARSKPQVPWTGLDRRATWTLHDHHFPIQKRLKILSNRSSLAVCPVT